MSSELSPDQKKQIEKKVEEFLPDFIAHIDKPNKQYAINYAIERLSQELSPTTETD